VSSLNCETPQFVQFRRTLRTVTGTRAGWEMGWSGMPCTLIFR